MNPTREEVLFALILEKPAEMRSTMLDAVCAGEPTLRQRLEALLAAHEQTDALLATEPDGAGLRSAASAQQARATIKLDLADAPDEAVGQTIGRYKLLQKIGEGGCGVVYMAEQEEPVRRRVALKVIKLGMDTKQVVARFEAERQALAMMDHPNIAKVLDGGATEKGRPFFVMELVRGIKITDYCDQNNVTTQERLHLFTQVCRAVQHAHQKGIIHRDIKPSNILVTMTDGVPMPKVIDFGIAKATQGKLTDQTLFTPFEQFIGTPAYMSPEQAEMSAIDIDTRSDIYSLGVLLYELLTGKTPFDAKDLIQAGLDEMRRTIREKEPARPSTRLSTMVAAELSTAAKHRQTEAPKLIHFIRGDLDWIVMKCLEKDRTRRYETANGLALDIQRHWQNEPVTACPPSQFYLFQKLARRHKLAIIAGGAVAAALILGLAISSWLFVREKKARTSEAVMRGRAEEAQRRAEAEAIRAKTASARANDSEQKARKALSASEFLQGCRLISEKKPGTALAYLARCSMDDPDNRAAVTSMVSLLASHSWMVPILLIKPVNSAEFSPDGTRIVTGADDGTATVWDGHSGREICHVIAWTLPPQSPPFFAKHEVNSARFSPDGKRFAAASWDQARIWDARTGQPMTGLLQHSGLVTMVEFSPDQSRLATVCGPSVWIWDAESGRRLMELTNEFVKVDFAQFSPDGKCLLGASLEGVRVWDTVDGHLVAKLKHNNFVTVNAAQFSPDGKRIVTACEDGVSQVWDVETGEPAGSPWQHMTELISAQFTPDGKSIVTATVGGAISMWNLQAGKSMPGLPGQKERPNVVKFGGDGRRIVTAAGEIACVWDAQTRQPVTEALQHGAVVRSAQFSPDGKRLLTVARDGTAQVWGFVNIPPQTPVLLKHAGGLRAAEFSRNGNLVLTASDSAVRVWDAQTGRPLTKPLRHSLNITSAKWSPDGSKIVTASLDKTAEIWDARSGVALTKPLEHAAGLNDAEFSPDGRRIVTSALDGTTWVWDAESGQQLLAKPLKHGGWLTMARFSPDGKCVVTASQDGSAGIWDAESGQSICVVRKGNFVPVIAAEFSADSKHVLTVLKNGTASVWDARTGELVAELGGEVMAAQFSPEGRRIVTISAATVRVWDAKNGQPLTDPMQLNGAASSAQFSPDGDQIVTAEAGGTQIWDAVNGQRLTEEFHHGRNVLPGNIKSSEGSRVVELLWPVNSAHFSSDGRRVVTCAQDGYARIWDVAPLQPKRPQWLPEVAEAISGQRLDERGVLEPTQLSRAEVIARLRKELNSGGNDDDWVAWGSWFFGDRATRGVSPFAIQTVGDFIDERIAENSDDSLWEAERVAGDEDAFTKRIAEARASVERAAEIAALRQKANSRCADGQQQEAISLLTQFCDANPSDTDASLTLAVWEAWFGDDADYENTRRRLVHQAVGTDDAGTAERAAKAYCLRPSTDTAMLSTALALAQNAVELGKSSSLLPWYRLELGVAQFRNGQYAAAQESLAAAEQSVGNENQDIQGAARYFRAMSLFKLGRAEEARTVFRQEAGQMWPLPNDETKPVVNGGLVSHDWLILWLAYKEAKACLNEEAAQKR